MYTSSFFISSRFVLNSCKIFYLCFIVLVSEKRIIENNVNLYTKSKRFNGSKMDKWGKNTRYIECVAYKKTKNKLERLSNANLIFTIPPIQLQLPQNRKPFDCVRVRVRMCMCVGDAQLSNIFCV